MDGGRDSDGGKGSGGGGRGVGRKITQMLNSRPGGSQVNIV